MPGFFEALIASYGALVDFTTSGAVPIQTLAVPGAPDDFQMRSSPLLILLDIASSGGTLTTVPRFSIGYNASDYDNLVAEREFPAFSSTNQQAVIFPDDGAYDMGDATDLQINIRTAAVTASGPFDVKVVVIAVLHSHAGSG